MYAQGAYLYAQGAYSDGAGGLPEMTFIHYGDKDPTPEDIVEVYQKAVRERLAR